MKKFALALFVGAVGLMLKTAIAHAQLDHMICYKVTDGFKFATPPSVDMLADLQPEFTEKGCTLIKPVEFCVPANKTNVTPAAANVNPDIVGAPLQNDYVCYSAKCPKQVEPSSKVVTDQFGTHKQKKYKPLTVCVPAVKAPVECNVGGTGITGAAMCNGACPDPTQTCKFDRKNKTCTCVDQTSCTGKPNSARLCGGPCPAPEVCLPQIKPGTTTLECACQNPPPPGCGLDPATGTCGGTCPNATDKCSLDASGQCSCQPGKQECGTIPGSTQCGGICPLPGQQCHPDSTGACTCVTPCGQNPLTGQCGGDCPTAGEVCILTSDGCACQPPTELPCSVDAQGICGGKCPLPDQQCRPDASGACNCQPASSPCGTIPGTNQCGGVCPAGTTCTAITTAGATTCGCVIPSP